MLCVDDRMGMLFGGRRQSQDSVLRADVLAEAGDAALWMDAYSAKQFAEDAARVTVAEDCLERTGAGECCFIERQDAQPWLERVEKLVLYRWNRHYPADRHWETPLVPPEWVLQSACEFAGSSHEKITKEVYVHEKSE